jgi:hypothetical protein
MSDIAARCRSCGYEQTDEFPQCPVCGATGSFWWCLACREWRDSRACPTCGGFLIIPETLDLGSHPLGTRVPLCIPIRNPGNRLLEFSIYPDDFAVSLPVGPRGLRGRDSSEVHGSLLLEDLPPGRKTYTVHFMGRAPIQTTLVVNVVPPAPRIEFSPTVLVLKQPTPGKALRKNVTVKNTGNVALVAIVRSRDPWLKVQPAKIELARDGSASLRLSAVSRRNDGGIRKGRVLVEARGEVWELLVELRLPEPKLEAEAVDLGTVYPERPLFESVAIRNTGKVRVACTLSCPEAWLAVTPKRVSLPPGREKVVRLRAFISGPGKGERIVDIEGTRVGSLVVAMQDRELLRVPVTAHCHVPRPILGPIRRQTIGEIANDAPVVRRFRVANTGDGRLECSVSCEQPWVVVLTPEVRVGPGKKRRVEFRIDTPRMQPGSYRAVIHVRAGGGSNDVPISFTVVEPRPELEVLGDTDLGVVPARTTATGHISVRNVGVGWLTLRAESESPRLKVTPETVAVAPGPPVKLAVALVVDGLEGGSHAFGVRLSGNGCEARAVVRLRLPFEQIDAPSLIDLGDRLAGRSVGDSLRLRNTGPDPVILRVLADDAWVRPAVDQATVPPGETVAVPLWIELRPGMVGPAHTVVRVEGRSLRLNVALRVNAHKVDLVALPRVVELGKMVPREERTVTLRVENRGRLSVEIRETHISGDLEVRWSRLTLRPGETGTLTGQVRLNAKGVGKQVTADATLAEGTTARFTATVIRSKRRRIAAALAAIVGLGAGWVLGSTAGWVFGGLVAAAAVVAAGLILVSGEG